MTGFGIAVARPRAEHARTRHRQRRPASRRRRGQAWCHGAWRQPPRGRPSAGRSRQWLDAVPAAVASDRVSEPPAGGHPRRWSWAWREANGPRRPGAEPRMRLSTTPSASGSAPRHPTYGVGGSPGKIRPSVGTVRPGVAHMRSAWSRRAPRPPASVDQKGERVFVGFGGVHPRQRALPRASGVLDPPRPPLDVSEVAPVVPEVVVPGVRRRAADSRVVGRLGAGQGGAPHLFRLADDGRRPICREHDSIPETTVAGPNARAGAWATGSEQALPSAWWSRLGWRPCQLASAASASGSRRCCNPPAGRRRRGRPRSGLRECARPSSTPPGRTRRLAAS